MTTEQFVHAIKEAVYEPAFSGLIEALKSPPGRRPDQRLLRLSKWFNGLPPEDQAMAIELARTAAEQFGGVDTLVLGWVVPIPRVIKNDSPNHA